MHEFQYTGVDKGGKKVQGKIAAPNEGEVRLLLRGQGIRPMRIKKASMLEADIGTMLGLGSGKIPLEQLAIFTRQLHVLIGSGIPMVQSLEILADQSQHPGLKKICSAVKEKVSGGSFLWEALEDYKHQFPRIYVALIRAGESSGAMEIVLDRLAIYAETADKLQKQLKAAMMYPVIVIAVGVGVVTCMLYFVVPKFESMLTNSGQALPAPTQFLIDLSKFLQEYIFHLLGGLAAFGYILKTYVNSKEGRGVFHRIMWYAPVFGPIMQKAGTARFTRTMGTLLGSGVNLIDAIEICRATVDNAVLEKAVGKIRQQIESGRTLGATLNGLNEFPKMASQMVAVGEQTGNLERMLDRIASIYENEVENLVGGLSKLIEPIILVGLGGAVAGIMIAMYMPIFKMAEGFQ